MSELQLLQLLLLVSMAVGPFGTHLFLERSRLHTAAHVAALGCAAVGLFASLPLLCVAWLLFCAARFALFLRARARHTLAASVPFVFSNIAAVWLVAGANDLHLLGYGVHFSYYAALHGNVLGWILIGALASLANDDTEPRRTIYLVAVLVALLSFLLIAFGIDRLRDLKPIGVVGLSIAIPLAQLTFLRSIWSHSRVAFALACISLAGFATTMLLAWRNELAMPVLPPVAGVNVMVSVHGVLNALVVAPCFLLAVLLGARGKR